jgi:HlyD family secretion protein
MHEVEMIKYNNPNKGTQIKLTKNPFVNTLITSLLTLPFSISADADLETASMVGSIWVSDKKWLIKSSREISLRGQASIENWHYPLKYHTAIIKLLSSALHQFSFSLTSDWKIEIKNKNKNKTNGVEMHLRSFHYAAPLLFPLLLNVPLFASADVSALGRIEPKDGVMHITAPVVLEAGNGLVLGELFVATGDIVEQGTLLAVTESHGLLESLKIEADASHQLALKETLASKALANAECVRAKVSRREADRRRSLLDQNLSSIEESERASADAEFQEAGCRAAQIVAEASLAAVNVAKARLDARKVMLARANVYAPFTGRVLSIATWPGEAIGRNGILEFGRTDSMYAIAEIYETEIAKVRIDQQATITSGALTNPLRGTVERIRPLIRKQDVMGTDPAARKDARIIEVEIRIDDSEAVSNLTNLQVEILIEN